MKEIYIGTGIFATVVVGCAIYSHKPVFLLLLAPLALIYLARYK